MQTFLPLPDFDESARLLDRQRLGNQRVETMQILSCLLGEGSQSWHNHPAVRMWRGYEYRLAVYGVVVCTAWIERGYRDSLRPEFVARIRRLEPTTVPPWFGDFEFHESHRSNLIRKAPDIYGPLWPEVDPDLPYVWPVERKESDDTA